MFGFSSSGWHTKLRQFFSRAPGTDFTRVALETLLYEADFPAQLVGRLISAVENQRAKGRDEILVALLSEATEIVKGAARTSPPIPIPGAILLIGVNGAGKTTVAGKLAKKYRNEGKGVVLAAADTFRAGAIDQMRIWGERVGADVVAQAPGADPGAVVFDAWQKAVARNAVMIADTAGRLHTKQPLVEQLRKVVRVLGKDGRGAPHETYLVLDGTTGQNALAQAREFSKAIPVTGLIVTKLDGTAKGGAALHSSLDLSLPIRYLGIGEKAEDLVEFEPTAFAQELFHV
jgi:fused signal recognition particle receptor